MFVLISGRHDSRHACPPPIPLEQSRQNVPSSSHYISLKRNRASTSGNTENKVPPGDQKTDLPISVGQATGEDGKKYDRSREESQTDREKVSGVMCTCGVC